VADSSFELRSTDENFALYFSTYWPEEYGPLAAFLVGIIPRVCSSFCISKKSIVQSAVSRDRLLTNVSLYWFTGTAGSSANLYYEVFNDPTGWTPKPCGTTPTAVAVSLTKDVAIRRFAERDHHIVRWTEFDQGGHFAAMEAPDFLIREFFRSLR